MVEGQLIGGLAQGIGGTFFEEFLYDERGEPLSVTFMDYLLPTVREVPVPELMVKEAAPSSRKVSGAGRTSSIRSISSPAIFFCRSDAESYVAATRAN